MKETTKEIVQKQNARASVKESGRTQMTSKAETTTDYGIKKQYLKSRNACKVTFKLSRIATPQADKVCIAGEFNNWNTRATPMKKLKSGDFSITLELEPGREYQFRYLIDDARWENDWNADAYVRNPYGYCDNSVVLV
jgi:1,4-alpha-glucan branching enzyme